MRYTNQFNDFDPLTGVIPSHLLGGHLRAIGDRARSVLKGRTLKELDSAAQFIDWVIDVHIEELGDGLEAGDGELPERSDHHDVEWFKLCAGKLSFSNNKDFVNGNYNHYFAVLALWKVIDAMAWFGSIPASYPNVQPVLSLAAEYTIQAMEAICIADLHDIANYWQRRSEKAISVANKVSDEHMELNVARHHENNLKHDQGVRLYLEKYTHLTNSMAANRIAKQVVRSKETVLDWLNKKNLENWLSKRPLEISKTKK